MDNKNVLGSVFEVSLRILLMLNEIKNIELDELRIGTIDFIAIYAADFGLLDENLHGDGNYRFSEYPARKELVSSAIKELALNNDILFSPSKQGFLYKVSPSGQAICNKLTSIYADEYRIAVQAVIQHYDISTSKYMLEDINHHIIQSLKENTNE